jgi:Lecithin retinol acyltransferase
MLIKMLSFLVQLPDHVEDFKREAKDLITGRVTIPRVKAEPLPTSFQVPAKEKVGLEPGDVVADSRTGYTHYGVYVGNESVVHYVKPENGTFKGVVRKTSLRDFAPGKDAVTVILFGEKYEQKRAKASIPMPLEVAIGIVAMPIGYKTPWQQKREEEQADRSRKYRVCTPDEVVESAMKQLGKKQYDLLFNNCEHFALFCKTGIHESTQVRRIFNLLPSGPVIYT